MIDIHILKEHIERIEPAQSIELKNTYGETILEITKTASGLVFGFSEPTASFNALVHITEPEMKIINGSLDIINADNETGRWNTLMTIYPTQFFSMEVKA